MAAAQEVTGTLIGTVKDAQGGVLRGAVVRVSSPALIGGPHDGDHERARAVALSGSASRTVRARHRAARDSGPITKRTSASASAPRSRERWSSRWRASRNRWWSRERARASKREAADSRPASAPRTSRRSRSRRFSMFDFIRAAPGVSPTSPGSVTTNSVSAFGSGTNENTFLIDGTNFTCPCSGEARSEPGVDFIQEVQVQSVGASAEFGNMQGAVVNVVTRQGSDRFLYDASYYGQTAGLTSQPVQLAYPGPGQPTSGYERVRYRDVTTNLGGPVVRDRLWFFAGYQHLRDYDSQPGTDPAFPRTYEQDKIFAKLTWRLAPGMQLLQSFHDEFWVNPELPTLREAVRSDAAPARVGSGHDLRPPDAHVVVQHRVGRARRPVRVRPQGRPEHGQRDDAEPVRSRDGCLQRRAADVRRTHAHSHDRQGHASTTTGRRCWAPITSGGSAGRSKRASTTCPSIIPTGVRFVDNSGQPFQAVSSDPSIDGRRVHHRLRVRERRHHAGELADDQRRAAIRPQPRHQPGPARARCARTRNRRHRPRPGHAVHVERVVAAPGRHDEAHRRRPNDAARELREVQPGRADRRARPVPSWCDADHDGRLRSGDRRLHEHRLGGRSARGTCSSIPRRARRARTSTRSAWIGRSGGGLRWRSPTFARTAATSSDGRMSAGSIARRRGRLPDGRSLPVFVLANSTADRRFLLTNPAGYSLTYNGLVMAVEKRRSHGWQAFGSYTWSRASGLQASSGATAAGSQVSTIAGTPFLTFGQDPNSLTNARGRLPNDRPHMLRVMGSVDVPRTGFVVAANVQHFSGKPWAATAQIALPQGDQRILLEPRGSRRLSSQTLLDLRVSRTISLRRLDARRAARGRAQRAQRHRGGGARHGQSVQPEFRPAHRRSSIRAARCSA